MTTYADLKGFIVNDGTVPPDLCTTEQIPYLVMVNRGVEPKKVILLELTTYVAIQRVQGHCAQNCGRDGRGCGGQLKKQECKQALIQNSVQFSCKES